MIHLVICIYICKIHIIYIDGMCFDCTAHLWRNLKPTSTHSNLPGLRPTSAVFHSPWWLRGGCSDNILWGAMEPSLDLPSSPFAHPGRSTQENWVWKSTVISFKWKKPWWEQQNMLVLIPQLMEFCILRRHNFAYDRASSGPHPVPSTQVGVLRNSSHPRVLLYIPKWISKMMPRRDCWWSQDSYPLGLSRITIWPKSWREKDNITCRQTLKPNRKFGNHSIAQVWSRNSLPSWTDLGHISTCNHC